jgi:hypothetical protein
MFELERTYRTSYEKNFKSSKSYNFEKGMKKTSKNSAITEEP